MVTGETTGAHASKGYATAVADTWGTAATSTCSKGGGSTCSCYITCRLPAETPKPVPPVLPFRKSPSQISARRFPSDFSFPSSVSPASSWFFPSPLFASMAPILDSLSLTPFNTAEVQMWTRFLWGTQTDELLSAVLKPSSEVLEMGLPLLAPPVEREKLAPGIYISSPLPLSSLD